MKLISWNVNGLRACLTHDFAASFAALDADVFSVQRHGLLVQDPAAGRDDGHWHRPA